MSTRMTKRTFLRSVGAAAGVGAVYRTMQALGLSPADGVARAAAPALPAGSGAGTHVVVLGAGIAGMTAAWELAAAGYRCTILEATGRAGGRSLTVRRGDVLTEAGNRQRVEFDGGGHLYANLGPARIPYHHEAVLGYCKAFGIELEVFVNDNRAALFHNRERLSGRPVTARRAVTDLRGYVAELLAKAVSRDALDSELTGLDKERVLAMLVEYGGLDPDRLYRGSDRAGYRGERINAGLEAGEVSDPLDFGALLETEFWEYKLHFGEFLDQNPTLFQPVGGMDTIVEAFRARVGGLVRYRSVVEEIRRTPGGGVRVVYRNADAGAGAGALESVEADFAISTVPAPVLKDVANDFAPETRAAIAALEFTPAVKIAFQARRRFWEEDHAIYGGISWTDQDITQIWYPSCGYHRDKGIVVGAYVWDDRPGQSERFARMTPHERLRAAIAEGERLHPGYGAEMESGISRAWSEVPFQKGAWPAGYPYEAPARLREPDGPVHFAGDQVSALPGWQEGAVLSAHAAVNAIGERVRTAS